jgi:vancomycin resistance protein YoaR
VEAIEPYPYRRLRRIALGLTIALISVTCLGTGAAVAVSARRNDPSRIASGVKIAGLDVGGLTKDEATEKLRAWARTRLNTAVKFKAPVSDRKWEFTLETLGGRFELPEVIDKAFAVGKDDNLFEKVYYGNRERSESFDPSFKIDDDEIKKALSKIAKTIRKPARNARAKMEGTSLVVSQSEQKGVKLDIVATKDALLKNGLEALADGEETKLVIVEEDPKVTADDLGKIGTLMASFTTDVGGVATRRHNVRLTAQRIDGTIIAPGDKFSYNDVVGERSAENGFQLGHQYKEGRVVDAIGGGVCQGSSTLYNAVLRADLKVLERENHSMRVQYVPMGCDATVAWDVQDFVFQNNTSGPIYIGGSYSGDRITFRIFGIEKPKREIVSVYTGDRKSVSNGGTRVTSYRKVKESDGTIKTETIDSSIYYPMKEAAESAPEPRRRPRPIVRRSKPRVRRDSIAPAEQAAPETPPSGSGEQEL